MTNRILSLKDYSDIIKLHDKEEVQLNSCEEKILVFLKLDLLKHNQAVIQT